MALRSFIVVISNDLTAFGRLTYEYMDFFFAGRRIGFVSIDGNCVVGYLRFTRTLGNLVDNRVSLTHSFSRFT